MLDSLWRKRPPQMVGIDIGSNSAKALLLSRVANGYQVENFWIEPMPEGAIVEQEIRDIAAVGDVLRRIHKRFGGKHRHAAIALPGSAVITKIIFMDAGLDDDELEQQIAIEADNLIPYPLDEVNLDFEIKGNNVQDPSRVDVLLSACRTEHVEARVAALEMARFEPKVLDVEGYALGRALDLQIDDLALAQSDPVVAVIDIGANLTSLSVIERGETIFTQQQPFGGQQYTQAISEQYDLRLAEAEQSKLSGEMPSGYQIDVLAPFQSALLQQIRRLLQMFYATHNRNHVDLLVLAGGTSLLRDLDQVVTDELQLPSVIANPFSEMVIGPRIERLELMNQAPRLMIAAGLAMRSFGAWRT